MENPSYRFIKQKIDSLNEQQLEKETYRELAATYIIRYLQAVNNLVLNYPAGSYKTKKAPLFSNYLKSIQSKADAIGNASENTETPSPLDFIFNESEGVIRTFTVIEDTTEEIDIISRKSTYIPTDNKYHKLLFCHQIIVEPHRIIHKLSFFS